MERIEYLQMAALEADFWWYRALHAVVAQRLSDLHLPEHTKVLDAGCGTGGLLHYLQQHTSSNVFSLSGIEWDANAAITAQTKTGLTITRGDINKLPYCNESFEIILSQDVLYHQNVHEISALNEFHRCLSTGGHVLFSLPAYKWMSSAHDVHVHGARRYTKKGCRELLEKNGFHCHKIGYWNSLLFPLMALQRLTVGKFRQESDVQVLPYWQNTLFFSVLDLERRLRLQLPFGGSVWAWGIKK